MPRTIIKQFEVEHLSILDENGNIDESIKPELSDDRLKEMYHHMLVARTFDEKLFKLQRSGKIGTYAQVKGQEACQIGSAIALEKDDWVVPSFREMSAMLTRGADKVKVVQSWNGDVRSYNGSGPNLPTAIPIASQLLHATGIAWAEKLKKTNNVVLTFFGDGATSEGDTHEAMNFAADFKLPVIFFCQNNQWAISTPRSHQMANETIAQRAVAYGMKGIQVDGNDVLAVYKATKEAIENARAGNGPTLIEGVTFRMGDHTTSDDSSKYRTEEMVKEWEAKDPLKRLRAYLQNKGIADDGHFNWELDTITKEIDEAVEAGLAIAPPPPENMFEHIYEQLTPDLQEQQEALLAELKEMQGGAQ
ncbi:MAG: pyruvate dehydrogenase (acetyl-transferring) E1 component subunit alpha [Nanoarchaeota archaeon]|nr:pyruvate dehydrogenase (acetyl-transferring) E1 component subunit alpha [Nanoarchaeota archaeon]